MFGIPTGSMAGMVRLVFRVEQVWPGLPASPGDLVIYEPGAPAPWVVVCAVAMDPGCLLAAEQAGAVVAVSPARACLRLVPSDPPAVPCPPPALAPPTAVGG